MKKLAGLLIVLVLSMGLVGCQVEKTVESKEAEYTNKIQEEAQRQVGQPLIDDFFEKKMFKKIYELRDNSKLVCYAYTRNLEGKYIYEGKVVGYGLPYSVQYNKPKKIADSTYEGGYAIVDQAEPNGMYMPDGLSATWLIMINEESGELEPAYYEPEIVVTQTKKPRRLVTKWSLPDNY